MRWVKLPCVILLAVLGAATARVALPAEIRPEGEPEWKRQMRAKLRESLVSYDFDQTPFEEAISALQRQTDISFTFEAATFAARQARPVTGFGVDESLLNTLESVLLQVELDYVLRRYGVFVATRGRLAAEGEIHAGPEWEREVRRKLKRRISFEFVDTPLTEGVQFFRTLTKINMILDPRALEEDGDAEITLKVTGERLQDAFDRVLELAGFDYALMHQAVFISTRVRLTRTLELDAQLAAAEAALREEKEPEWKRRMRQQLARRVTFEFVETPVQEAIQFLQTLTRKTFILDPEAVEGREATAVTLHVSNMTLAVALKWILRPAGLSYTVQERAVWISTPENVLAELRRRAEPEAHQAEPEWAKAFRAKLEREVSIDFVDTPLSETIQFMMTLSKCSMILDPRAVEVRGDTPINLKVSEMPLEQAFDWILRLAGLEYAFKDGAIFISTSAIIARERKAGLIPGSPTKNPTSTPPREEEEQEDVF